MSHPETNAARSEQRNATVFAMSSVRPGSTVSDPDRSPPTGVISAIHVLIGLCSSSSRPISVSMSPGESDTTRPPLAPHATAARSHSRMTPRFARR